MDLTTFANTMHLDPKAVERLSQSSDGQTLMALLEKQNANALQQATKAGESGSYAEMTALIKNVMTTQEGRALLQRLAKQLKG